MAVIRGDLDIRRADFDLSEEQAARGWPSGAEIAVLRDLLEAGRGFAGRSFVDFEDGTSWTSAAAADEAQGAARRPNRLSRRIDPAGSGMADVRI